MGQTEGGLSHKHIKIQLENTTRKYKREKDHLSVELQKIWGKNDGNMSKAELIMKWWDKVGRKEFKAVEGHDPGMLMNREHINELGQIVSDSEFGFEGLTRVYKNYLSTNGYYAEKGHNLHWFLKRFDEFTKPVKTKKQDDDLSDFTLQHIVS